MFPSHDKTPIAVNFKSNFVESSLKSVLCHILSNHVRIVKLVIFNLFREGDDKETSVK